MTRRDDQAHLLDVARAARLILQFAQETDREGFRSDALTQSAILHQFLVLGEAVKRLSPDFKGAYPDVPWREMAGMRDRLIHGYDVVNLDVVWETVVRDVPKLLSRLEPILPERPPKDRGHADS